LDFVLPSFLASLPMEWKPISRLDFFGGAVARNGLAFRATAVHSRARWQLENDMMTMTSEFISQLSRPRRIP
jgi:hypothetical protein